jgi:hypothetical protein
MAMVAVKMTAAEILSDCLNLHSNYNVSTLLTCNFLYNSIHCDYSNNNKRLRLKILS